MDIFNENVPVELKSRKCWVGYMLHRKDDKEKYDKLPVNPHSLRGAMSNNPQTWSDYKAACESIGKTASCFIKNKTDKVQVNGTVDGIGIMFSDDICGIDIDCCISDTGEMSATAKNIIDLMDTYTEYSPSGKGCHLLFKCDMSETPSIEKMRTDYYQNNRNNGVECYFPKITNRFFTFTAKRINAKDIENRTKEVLIFLDKYMKRELKSKGKPFNPTFESAHLAGNQIIEKALASKNGEAFRRLWNGEINGYNSASEADLALCNMLAFWTGKDNAMMDSLFRQSALMRSKWDERHGADTYGNMTIQKAVSITSEAYSPSHRIKDKDSPYTGIKNEKDDELNALYSETGYFVKNVCLWKYCKDDEKMLANFVPIPKEVVYKDDGLTVESWFKITAVKTGNRILPEAYIGTNEFASMSWIMKHWGFSANISPGVSAKDYLRHAIVEVGGRHALQKTVYTHTGWRKIGGKYVFLHSEGAIMNGVHFGNSGVSVELDDSLENYRFPRECEPSVEDFNAVISFMEVAPRKVTIPLVAIAFLSPLNEFFRYAGHEPTFVLFLLGMTGVMKSTLAALTLCFFGRFSEQTLPSNFKDTKNSLEKKGFILKDVLSVLDDFHPTTHKSESVKMVDTAQSVLRAYGDRCGKARLNADTSLKNSYVPRGNLIITGEDIPSTGMSGLARNITVELKKGDIDKTKISSLQARSDRLNIVMCGFIKWLADMADTLPNILKEKFEAYRSKFQSNNSHGRLGSAAAWLFIGYEYFLMYGYDKGVFNETETDNMKVEAFAVFSEIADDQNSRLNDDKPTEKFIAALREMLATNACYVLISSSSTRNEISSIKEGFIGYADERYYYLHPNTTYNKIADFYQSQGLHFPVTKDTLLKQLEAEGALLTETKNGKVRRTIQKNINGRHERLMWIKRTAIDLGETDVI